ncbi:MULTISPECIES: PotD/PotF family extracellular solute-binding protein [unclassified Bradyrhizobium]|uniref:ABC transporter substrate-binding protein n=1 Tax=unclassified Bradyrhizobium TaxID=2631580 RepID=UPI0028E96C28|nr:MULTISPECIES: extracellular solute-binding protein [unclassified Bradyrhizobium]
MRYSRRNFLSLGCGTGATFLFGNPRSVAAANGPIVVGTWGGDYGQLLGDLLDKPLASVKGVEVVQDVANVDPRKTKLLAERGSRRGSMEIACLSDTDAYLMSQSEVLEEIRPEQLSRLDAVFPELRKRYSIPHIYSAQVILYNPTKVTVPPQSYADLWDPKWRGRVGLSDILYGANTLAAALAGGGSVNDFEPADKKLLELRSLDARIYPSNEALAAGLKSEEVWITIMWLARGFMWKKAGIPLAHVVPKEGTPSVVFEAGIPRNARNKAGAFAYLDAMLDAKAQTGFAERMGYAPTVRDAVLPEDLAREVLLTEEERTRLLKLDYAYSTGRSQRTLDFWNKQFKA